MGLGEFAQRFRENGWDDKKMFSEMTDAHLKACGLKDGHIAKFRKKYPLQLGSHVTIEGVPSGPPPPPYGIASAPPMYEESLGSNV